MNMDVIGSEMKDYEKTNRQFLTQKVPVIIRIDGKSFHRVLGKFEPLNEKISNIMGMVTCDLLDFIQGSKIGYMQSDEISILVTDYDRENTCPWFGYRVDKICSVSASFATQSFIRRTLEMDSTNDNPENHIYNKMCHPICFDSRCFNISEDDVVSYFNWRHLDSKKNSISSYARRFFSHKQLFKRKSGDMINMLNEIGHSWKDLATWAKYGNLFVRCPEMYTENDEQFIKFEIKQLDSTIIDDATLDSYFRKENVSKIREEFRSLKKKKKNGGNPKSD